MNNETENIFRKMDDENYKTIEKDYITVVCISDTHMQHRNMPVLPPADILIHSGDFTNEGAKHEI